MKRLFWVVAIIALAASACSSGSDLEADAGSDFEISVGEAPEFDGCDSTGDISNYAWTIVDAPGERPDDEGKELRSEMSSCTFELESDMTIDDVGTWIIQLTVSDGDEEATDTVEVTVAG